MGYSKAWSSSGLELAGRCRRAWWFKYCTGRAKERELTWDEIKDWTYHKETKTWSADKIACVFKDQYLVTWCTSRDRSTILGKAVHTKLEGYFNGETVDWKDWPGQIALPGLAHWPHPSEVETIMCETEGELDGIPGTVDLILVLKDGRVIVGDHKTCKDFVIKTREGEEIYSHKPEAVLRKDRQVARYSLWVMRELGLDSVECRWVYYRTDPKKAREARSTVFVYTRAEAEDVFAGMLADAGDLQQVWRSTGLTQDDIPANNESCGMFGGCPEHHSNGGPCTARQSNGKVKALPRPEGIDITMASFKEQLEAKKAEKAAKEAAAKAEAQAEPETEPEAEAEPQPEPEPAKPAPKATVAKASAKPAATAPAATKPAAVTRPAPAPSAGLPVMTPDYESDVTVSITIEGRGLYMRIPAKGAVKAEALELAGMVLEG